MIPEIMHPVPLTDFSISYLIEYVGWRNSYWTPGRGRRGPINQDLSVLPSECDVMRDRAVLLEKNVFCPKKGENGTKMGQKFLLYLVPYTNSVFGKNLVPEIWAKVLSANQIAGFLNQLYLQHKMMKKPEFLHANTDSWKLKILVRLGQNWIGHSGFSTLKLAVSQEAINGIN